LCLSEFTTEGRCPETICRQLFGEIRRINAAIHEDQTSRFVCEEQDVHEGGIGLMAPNGVAHVLDVGVRDAERRTLDHEGIRLKAIR
jgi:hypothetical protein